MKHQLQDIKNWLGDRGIDYIKIIKSTKYKIIKNYLFLEVANLWRPEEKKTIELYNLNSMVAEIYSSWESSGFNWSNKNLNNIISNINHNNNKEQQ